jgi:RNA polymerase sigma-70 factor (ECF subfamily)
VNSEQQLVQRMARGDESAFEAIYQDHQRCIYRFSLHMSGDHAVAEEVTQDAFVALIEKPQGFDSMKGTLSAYLFGVARNLLRKRMRLDWSIEPLEFDLPAEEDDPVDSFTLEAVRNAVLSLPAVYREAVALCDLQESSYEEAAVILECAVGTVRSRLFRGRRMLASKLKGAVRV